MSENSKPGLDRSTVMRILGDLSNIESELDIIVYNEYSVKRIRNIITKIKNENLNHE